MEAVTEEEDEVYDYLPYAVNWMVQYMEECQGMTAERALEELYCSEFYTRLEDARWDLWHEGPVGLYELLCDEKGWPRPEKRVEHWEPGAGGAEKR